MLRRCVSLFLIAGFFISQLVGIPHTHGALSAEDRQKHDATPHFHCQWLGNGDHDYDHNDAHHNHSHSYSGQRNNEGSTPFDDSDGQPLSAGLIGWNHDVNAIVVPGPVWAIAPSSLSEVAALVWQLAALVPLRDCFGGPEASLRPSLQWHPPDEVLDASYSYLTLRNLRI